MFIRVKSTPNSPRKSVQIVHSHRIDGKVKQRIVKHVGVAQDDEQLEELKSLANSIKVKLELDEQLPLYTVDEIKQLKKYEKKLPYYNYRHLVAPGITGWAQVNYPYGFNLEDTKQKLMYDFYYIKNWNLWLELKIVWKTAMVVLKKKGV